MGMGMGTILRHEQFLNHYNIIQQIGHHYSIPNKVSVLPRTKIIFIFIFIFISELHMHMVDVDHFTLYPIMLGASHWHLNI